MWRKAVLSGVAASLAAGGVAYEIERRRLRRARDADPAWHALTAPLKGGRVHEVISDDGTRIRATVYGEDNPRTIVLIHGWLESSELWRPQIRALSDDFRVVVYEQRGHAGSAPPESEAYTDEALSDDLEAVLQACVPPGTQCVLAGHSMGGMTIVAWGGRHAASVPERVAAVVFLNTGMSEFVQRATVLGEGPGRRLHRAGMHVVFLTQLAWPPLFDYPAYWLTRRMAFGPKASVGQVAFGHRMFVTSDPEVRAGFGRMLLTLDLLPSVAAVTVPAIVVGSRFDRLLPLWYSEQLAAALPDLVEFVELTEVGHMSMIEEPERVTALIGRLSRACLPAQPRTREPAAARAQPEVAAVADTPRTPEPDPDHVRPEDVAEMSQGAAGEAAESAGELSANSRRRRRPRKDSAAAKSDAKHEPTSR